MTLECVCSPLLYTIASYLCKKNNNKKTVSCHSKSTEPEVSVLRAGPSFATHWLFDLEQSHFKGKGLSIVCVPPMCQALGHGLRTHVIIKSLPHHYKEVR